LKEESGSTLNAFGTTGLFSNDSGTLWTGTYLTLSTTWIVLLLF